MKAKDAKRYAERAVAELEHEARQIALRKAFHRGQLDIFEKYDVRDRDALSTRTSAPEVRRKRVHHRKPRANSGKARLYSYLEGNPNTPFSVAELNALLGIKETTLKVYLSKLNREGVVTFEHNAAIFTGK
jgi:Fic family protein